MSMADQKILEEDVGLPSPTGHFSFRGPHSWKLHACFWKTTSPNVRGTVVGIHGYTEHSQRYGHFAQFLNRAGFDVAWMDLPGHGESDGRKANIDHFDDYVESFECFFRSLRLKGFKAPYILFAHSLGGLVAIRFLQSSAFASDFSRAVLSSPLLGLSPHAFYGVGRFAQGFVGAGLLELVAGALPNLTLSNERDLAGGILTHDETMAALRKADPLIEPQVTIRWTKEFLKARRAAFKQIEKIQLPMAIFQAGDDRVVSPTEPERFMHLLGSKEKSYHVYEGMFHEILNEVDRHRVMKDVLRWIEGDSQVQSKTRD